jgi:hypothetical protein
VVVDRSRKQIHIARERSRPGILALGVVATLLYAGFNWVESAEVLELETRPKAGASHGAEVTFVDDAPFMWVRDFTRDAPWLDDVRAGARVGIDQGAGEALYHATVWRDPEGIERATRLFGEKYGPLARVAPLFREPVTVRLERTY